MSSPAEHRQEPSFALRQRFHAGEAMAVDELFGLLHGEVLRYGQALLGDEDTAWEALQETFLRLLERHRSYDPAREFRPWLFTVARNVCLTLLRRRTATAARVVDLEPTDDEVARLASTAPAVLDRLLGEEAFDEASRALHELPESQRLIVVMHLFENLTFREIADHVGRPANTVATVYYRALQQLRAVLQQPDSSSTKGRSSHAS